MGGDFDRFDYLLFALAKNSADIGGGGFAILCGALGDWIYLRHWIRHRIDHPENANLLAPARAIITEETIVIESKVGVSSTFPWHTLVKIGTDGSDYLLYYGHNTAIRMFRRAQSEEDWQKFTDLAESWKARLKQQGSAEGRK